MCARHRYLQVDLAATVERQLQPGVSEGKMAEKNQVEATRHPRLLRNEEGAIGYIAAWFLGIPASVLFLIFLMRGCN
jgi:hypothetical protein